MRGGVNAQDYLSLRLLRLKSAEEKLFDQEGLCFVLLKGGNGMRVAGQSDQRLAPGDMLVVEGAAGVKLCVSKGEEAVFWFFSLRLEHIFTLFDGKEVSLFKRITAGFKSPKLIPASAMLAIECRRLIEGVPPQFNLDHRSQLLRVAAAILSEEFKTAHNQRISSVSVEQRVIEVFENLTADQLLSLSVGELAAKFGCSRRHLNRLFHQFFGYSVASLRMEMRLLKAISLLRDTSSKVINVAEQCGFNHLGLFNTCFKRRFGESPGEWRKQFTHQDVQSRIPPAFSSNCPLHSKGLCPMAAVPYGQVATASRAASSQTDSLPKNRPNPLTANQKLSPLHGRLITTGTTPVPA